jgi:amidase
LGPWDKANRELWTNVDKNVYLDTPLCVQVVTPRLQEKRLIEAMKVIDEAVRAELAPSGGKARL